MLNVRINLNENFLDSFSAKGTSGEKNTNCRMNKIECAETNNVCTIEIIGYVENGTEGEFTYYTQVVI